MKSKPIERMFDFSKKKRNENEIIVPAEQSEEIIQNKTSAEPVTDALSTPAPASPELKVDEPHPFNNETLALLKQKFCYIMKIGDVSWPSKRVVFDKVTRRRWRSQNVLGFSPDALITEEEFCNAYIKVLAANTIRDKNSKVLEREKEIKALSARIDEACRKMEEVLRFISDIEKSEALNEQPHNADLNKTKALILRSGRFVFGSKESEVTPMEKKSLQS